MTDCDLGQSEWSTRKRLIDPKLKGLGWSVVPFDLAAPDGQPGCCAITEYPTANGPADYAAVDDLSAVLVALEDGNGPNGKRCNSPGRQ